MSNVAEIPEIHAVYGEILGIFLDLPKIQDRGGYATQYSVGQQFNDCLAELQELTKTNYSKYTLTPDHFYDKDGKFYATSIARPRIGSIIKRLEAYYGFGDNSRETPMVITVNNTNQVTVTVTPIQEIISNESDDEVKDLLIELREALKASKKSEKTSSILTTLQEKSWEVFIKALPYVLEQLGK